MSGLGGLMFEEAAELATGGFKGSQILFRVAVVEQGATLAQRIKDESLDLRLSQNRGFI